jgi:hypothetical protein
MSWTTLRPALRRAIMREAVRRGLAIDAFFFAIGGTL